ncbi:hypothetical protein ALC56_15345 [Trachymyrmex septentrionalis]|uniref:Uncharacterized protein n=1 Tax=Trachymyrmex septentrionalis TaxID=34720 RepID=A0A151JSL9_9HYME|nr:hypothetical protein ALC56_15345 [Trachymyrmex septentrionalis]
MEQPNPARSKQLAAMERDKLRMGIGLLIEYLPLRAHIFNIGLVDNWKAPYGEKSEDSVHLLCCCPMLACKKYRSRDHMFLTSEMKQRLAIL